MKPDYDIAVVGAGIVGAALATGLAQQGFKVAVIEPQSPVVFEPSVDYGLRVSAIGLAARNFFQHLAVWPMICAQRYCAYRHMSVWAAGGSAEVHFSADTLGETELGYIIENDLLQSTLQEQLQRSGAHLFWQRRLQGLHRQGTASIMLNLDDGNNLSVSLAIGADGARSLLRRLSGMQAHEKNYQQQAIVAVVETEASHRDTAWQRFLADGVLAFLPLRDGRCSIVWSVDTLQAEHLLTLPDVEFCAQLGEAFGYRLGEIRYAGPRAAFPLLQMHAAHYVASNIALVGDAAHVVHPLAGQGVNMGLLDAMQLIDVLVQARAEQRPLGGLPVLRRYQRARYGENQMMLFGLDGLHTLFAQTHPVIAHARNIGLRLVNHAAPLKHFFMRRAMGLSEDLPTLAQPLLRTPTE